MRRPLLALLLFLLAALPARAQVPPDRVAALAAGVSIPHWWWLPMKAAVPRPTRMAYFNLEDAQQLAAAGMTHVRMPIDPSTLYDQATGKLKPDDVTELLATIRTIQAGGLAVIVDVHPMGTDTKSMLADQAPDSWAAAFKAFWTVFAPAMAQTDPDRTILELLNEPYAMKHGEWARVQEETLPLVRAACPKHTILLTGDGYGSIDTLTHLTPVSDTNVVYSFHFYEPHAFTHQSAVWGSPAWKFIKGLTYPTDEANVDTVASETSDPAAVRDIRQYGKEHWDAARVRARIQQAADWGAKHHVVVYMGEFGVLRDHAPAASRQAWLKDVADAARANHVGWAMWDYGGGFALINETNGKRTIDPGTAKALGLKLSDAQK